MCHTTIVRLKPKDTVLQQMVPSSHESELSDSSELGDPSELELESM